jgi:hypothetical protein
MTTKAQRAEAEAAVATLREMLHPGDTVHTILRHVSASGMLRHVDVMQFSAGQGGQKQVHQRYLSYLTAKALGYKLSDSHGSQGAIKVAGAGMDMGFALVYNLSSTLFPDGFECIGERCPSNDHSNGDRDYAPHHHNNGGYALLQRWL